MKIIVIKKIHRFLKLLVIDTLKHFILIITYIIPQGIISITIRGFFLKFFFKSYGEKFKVDSGVTILHSKNIEIGKDVYFARNVWINGAGGLIIGSNVMIGPMTIVTTGQHVFCNHILTKQALRKHVEIGSNTWIAGNVTITDGVIIGNGVLVAAGSVVTKNIPDNSIVAGVPAKIIGMTK